MIEIFLDNRPVFRSDSKELKISCENPSLTESGSYTLEVEFPLSIPQNLAVFGHISRIDIKKNPQHFTARIRAAGKEMFNGSAILTGVTQDTVKVQLVGGNAEANFFYRYEEQYVDELPFDVVDLQAVAVENGANLSNESLTKEEKVALFGGIGVPKYYMQVPTYDSTNDYYLNLYKKDTLGVWVDIFLMGHRTKAPSFLWVLRSVIEAMGYHVTRCDYDETPVQHMYIAYSGSMAGPGSSIQLSDAKILQQVLPHWKVQDFISQVQDFLNCTVEFLSVGKEARIIRNIPANRQIQVLNVVDEFNVEISEDDNNDEGILGTSTPYYSTVDSKLKDVWEYFEHKSFNTMQEVEAYAETLSEEEKCKILFETPTGTMFWDKHINFGGLGVWRSLTPHIGIWRGEKKLKELKINSAFFPGVSGYNGTVAVPMTWSEEMGETSIWQAVDDDADYGNPHEDKEDAMYVMYVYPGQLTNGGIPWPTGSTVVYPGDNQGCWTMDLHLSAPSQQFSIGDLHSTALKPQDKVLQHFSFLSDEVPDVSSVFFIHGKRYMARKIEYSLKDDGVNPLMTGEFYELES